MKIAIVRLSSLGDIIFGMASLQFIRGHVPGAAITWVADSKFADVLDCNPDLESVVKLDLKGLKKRFSWDGVRAEYRKLTDAGDFDLVIDLHGMIKSALVARRLGGVRTGFHRSVVKEPLATFFYTKTFTIPLSEPAVNRYSALIDASLGVSPDLGTLTDKAPFLFHLPEHAAVTADYFRHDRKNIVLVPETSIDYKNYPKEKWVAVANAIKENILVCHGSPAELATANYLAEHSPYVTILPRLDLNQLKAVISRADLVIGGDTGPTHMAWACNVPSLALFGATAPPYAPTARHRVLTSGSRVNPARPDKADVSIRMISDDEIVRQAEELLNL